MAMQGQNFEWASCEIAIMTNAAYMSCLRGRACARACMHVHGAAYISSFLVGGRFLVVLIWYNEAAICSHVFGNSMCNDYNLFKFRINIFELK